MHRWLAPGVAIVLWLGGILPAGAQAPRPLRPLPDDGLGVTPFFDGWFSNADGSATFSFGYLNLNKHEVVEVPYGPDNVIEPREFDGRQPTAFPPVPPDEPGAGAGSQTPDPRHRARGVFTVTVPNGFQGEVVWTLRSRGRSAKAIGRTRSTAYQLTGRMAMGSTPPLLRFRPGGPAGRGPAGIQADPVRTSVRDPIRLTIWLTDDSVREALPVPLKTNFTAKMHATWYKHSGPGPVVFTPPREPIVHADGRAGTTAAFAQPGEYVIRVRGDNFGEVDGLSGEQCCWTNGYVRVTVTP